MTGAITRHTAKAAEYLHNSCILFENGTILASAHKRLLPFYDVFDETRYFEPGGPGVPVYYKGTNLVMTICEDIWNDKDIAARQLYTVDPVADLLASTTGGADLLINIAASPFPAGQERRTSTASSATSATSTTCRCSTSTRSAGRTH